jgi:hypothetical protein
MMITTQTPNSITGYVTTKANASCVVATILSLIFIIPAIIYLVAASKDITEPFTITLIPVEGDTRLHGDGRGRAFDAISWATSQLPGGTA